jgi:hypothetical protein
LGFGGGVVEEPEAECWLHPEIGVRPSTIAGLGLFACEAIAAGVVVSRVGGRLVDQGELERLLAPGHPYVDTITVGVGVHLVLPGRTANGYGNHSCDPNTWWVGAYELATRRALQAGDEVTNDYATSTDAPGFVMVCRCGSSQCRGTVSGEDWRRPELQARYGEHWVPALLERQRAASKPPSTGMARPVR